MPELKRTRGMTRAEVAEKGPYLNQTLVRSLNVQAEREAWYNSPHQVVCVIARARGCDYYDVREVTQDEVRAALATLKRDKVPVTQFDLGVKF
jgi:uncharacterized protein YbjT (DUF2867 family)